jgi:hypothetical protein
MMMVLNLVLTHHWFDEVASGIKRIEYREMSAHWSAKIACNVGKITHVRFSRGYTKTQLLFKVDKIDVGSCPYEGWSGSYFRIHFSAPTPTTPLATKGE